MTIAGKTGTTSNDKDVWFVGYTPYYVGATYLGDDAGRKDPNGNTISRKGISGGSSSAAKLWSTIMNKIHKNLTKTDFKVPKNIYFTKINLIDGGRSSSGSNAAFIKGTGPSRYTSQPSTPTKTEENTNQNQENTQPETPVTPETPATPETPTVPEAPTAPETPVAPQAATVPETPTTPEAPITE
jgi:penicillin-binding protein 1A